jgi:cell division protein FtsN
VGSAATTAQPPQRPASAAPPAAAGSFQLAVAAFKTQSRADEVTRALAALDVPASVRLDPTGTWYRVVAGPFATREAAVSAQDALARQGYAGTRISPVASDNR